MNRDYVINEFSVNVLKLQEQENNTNPSKQHIVLFDKMCSNLLKGKKFGQYQTMWEELYRRSLYFYQFVDNINGIPTVLVTKHNDIVPWYAKQEIHKVKDTIWHLDTHSDQSPVKNAYQLPVLYKSYIDTKDKMFLDKINKIVWDIGAAVSGILYTTGIRDYVWGIPSWLPDPNISMEYFLKGKKTRYLASNDQRADSLLIDAEYTTQKPKDKTAVYTKIQTMDQRQLDLKLLKDSIRKNGNTYILDIDLDYFVCNGKGLDRKTYFKDPYDVRSFYRTKKIIFNQDIPREANFESTELKQYNRLLAKETKEIDKRIRDFLKMIRKLTRSGLKPSYISICDSTNIEFEKCDSVNPYQKDCNSVSNGYVPANLALYVHTKVIHGLQTTL